MNRETDTTIHQIEFELEKAEHGMGLPYDAERVGQLRKMLVEARKRKPSRALAAKRSPRARGAKADARNEITKMDEKEPEEIEEQREQMRKDD